MTSCVLVIPAYQEQQRIADCLESVLASTLPCGFEWERWIIFDDASTDGTSEAVRSWQRARPAPPVELIRAPHRIGKSAAIDQVHQYLLTVTPDIAVSLDADLILEPTTMRALLRPMAQDPDVAIVWGISWPDQFTCGRRASAFQLVATHELTRILGEDAVRAESKFVAYRLPAFADMRWRSDLVGEDHQLAAFAFERALRVRSAFDARVLVTPARGYTDFYTQTYRHFGTRRAARAYTSRPMPRPQPRDRARGLARAARHDPAGAVAYAAARMAAAFRHRVAPIELFPPGTWVSAPSTKGRRRAAGAG